MTSPTHNFRMKLMMAMRKYAKTRKMSRKASRKPKRKASRKPKRKTSRKPKRKTSRKASEYAIFTKEAYAGKVKGLKLKSLANLTTEARKLAFKDNAKAISKAYNASKKKTSRKPKSKASRKPKRKTSGKSKRKASRKPKRKTSRK